MKLELEWTRRRVVYLRQHARVEAAPLHVLYTQARAHGQGHEDALVTASWAAAELTLLERLRKAGLEASARFLEEAMEDEMNHPIPAVVEVRDA